MPGPRAYDMEVRRSEVVSGWPCATREVLYTGTFHVYLFRPREAVEYRGVFAMVVCAFWRHASRPRGDESIADRGLVDKGTLNLHRACVPYSRRCLVIQAAFRPPELHHTTQQWVGSETALFAAVPALWQGRLCCKIGAKPCKCTKTWANAGGRHSCLSAEPPAPHLYPHCQGP